MVRIMSYVCVIVAVNGRKGNNRWCGGHECFSIYFDAIVCPEEKLGRDENVMVSSLAYWFFFSSSDFFRSVHF